jgi:hypothetical protein
MQSKKLIYPSLNRFFSWSKKPFLYGARKFNTVYTKQQIICPYSGTVIRFYQRIRSILMFCIIIRNTQSHNHNHNHKPLNIRVKRVPVSKIQSDHLFLHLLIYIFPSDDTDVLILVSDIDRFVPYAKIIDL